MKTLTITLLATLILASCHILKKDKVSLKKLQQKEALQVEEQRNRKSQQSEWMLVDSSHNDFTLWLWPKGKFTFSRAKGFEGEAEKVLLKGKLSRELKVASKQQTKQDSTRVKSTYAKEQATSLALQKKKFSVANNWGWVLVLLIGLVLIWVYRKFK